MPTAALALLALVALVGLPWTAWHTKSLLDVYAPGWLEERWAWPIPWLVAAALPVGLGVLAVGVGR